MKITGHRTRGVFERYITDQSDTLRPADLPRSSSAGHTKNMTRPNWMAPNPRGAQKW